MNDQDLEKQLNNLPKMRLSLGADIKIRFRFFIVLGRKRLSGMTNLFQLKSFSLRLAMSMIIGLIVIFLPIYAYASSQVLPNNFLYPLRISLEQLELKLAGQGERQVKTLIKLADRRLIEAQALSQATGDVASQSSLIQTVNQAVKLDQQATAVIDQIKDEQPKDQAEQALVRARSQQVSKLNQIAGTVGIESDEKTLDAVALALDNLKEKINQPLKKLDENLSILIKEETRASSTEIIKEQAICPGKSSSSDCVKEGNIVSSTTIIKIEDGKNQLEKTDLPIRQEVQKQIATSSFEKLEREINKLKQDLSPSWYEPDDVKILFNRLHKKLDGARQALDEDKINSANGIIKSTRALTNNAESFLKKKHDNNLIENQDERSKDSIDGNNNREKPGND